MRLKLNAAYGGVHATYWMIYCVIVSFASAFLLERGYNNTQIGVILAAANVVSVVIQPFLADLADRSQRVSLIGVTEIADIFIGITLACCMLFPKACLALSVLYVLIIACHTALQPLFNSLAFRLGESGHSINFGVTRAAGSLFYAILCAAMGVLVERFGTAMLPAAGEVTVILLLAVLVIVDRLFRKACQKRDLNRAAAAEAPEHVAENTLVESIGEDERGAESPDGEITLVDFIKRNKLFFIVNLGIMLVYFSNAITNNFMLQIVENVGGTSKDMGNILSFMAFLEIPGLFLFDRIHKHFSNKVLLEFAAFSFFLKMLIIFLAKNVFWVYVAQLMQLTSFALFLPAIVSFTDEIMERGEAVKGQALYTVVITIATVAATLIGGFVLDHQGASAMMFLTVTITGIGALFFALTMEKLVKSRNAENRVNCKNRT